MSIQLITLAGSPAEMGYAHGRRLREQVHALAEERLRLALRDVPGTSRADALALAGEFLAAHRAYAPAVYEEFRGIAEGAEIAPELLLIGNGYTDYKDVLPRLWSASASADAPKAAEGSAECTSFLVSPAGSADGRTYLGQNWDMHGTAEPFVVAFHRQPTNGPQTLAVTTAGCLSLVGLNEHGIALGNNNLVPTDARPGVIYLAMIHHALAQRTWEDAQRAITECPRASGHNYFLAGGDAPPLAKGGQGGSGHVCDIETTALETDTFVPDTPTYTHANHYQSPRLQSLAAPGDTANSRARERRLGELLAARAGTLDVPSLFTCLGDHEGDPHRVCVHGSGGDTGQTCAVIILCPTTRELWATVGPACQNELTRLALS
jgi:isopenicillin-N N-acyltransferase-like protein